MESKIVIKAKQLVIGFFVLVFVMGFFSRSIINLFLPKVMTEPAMEGTVERTLAIEGIIQAQKTSKIRLEGEALIEEYYVKNGDIVVVGQPLFKIDKTYGNKDNHANIERLKLQQNLLRQRIEDMKNQSYTIEQKQIGALENQLKSSNVELLKQQSLYAAGAISKQELENYQENIKGQELALELEKLQLEQKKKQALTAITEAENELLGLALQIQDTQKQKDVNPYVDKEGIFHSSINGVVTNVNYEADSIIRDDVALELAEDSAQQSLIFQADIEENAYDFIKSAGVIQISGKTALDSKYINVVSIHRNNRQGGYNVEGSIKKEDQTGLVIGQKLKGIVKQKYVQKGYNKVPKAAVIVYGEYKEGTEGIVYILEQLEGVLGKELRAKEVPVKLLAIGDDDVIVSGLEGFEDPKVIINLSYKISDGAKVFLWQ